MSAAPAMQSNLPGIEPGGRRKPNPRRSLDALQTHRANQIARLYDAINTGAHLAVVDRLADDLRRTGNRLHRHERAMAQGNHDAEANPFQCQQFAALYAPYSTGPHGNRQRAVFTALMARMDWTSRTVKARGPDLAADARLSLSTVWRAISDLEALGLLTRRNRYRGRRGASGEPLRMSNCYILATRAPEQGCLALPPA